MKPFYHARSSVKRWGGRPEDYQPIHDFIDSSKIAMGDIRHRAVLHSAFGIFVLERVFGTTITNSDGRQVPVRDVGEQHVYEDLGFIPSVERWLVNMPIEPWMSGTRRGRAGRTRLVTYVTGESAEDQQLEEEKGNTSDG